MATFALFWVSDTRWKSGAPAWLKTVPAVGKSESTVTLTSSPLIDMTAVVGGGAGGVFGAATFVFGGVADFDVEGPVAAAAPDFWTDWRNGSLLAKCSNSVSCPGSGCTCTEATIDCAGVDDVAAVGGSDPDGPATGVEDVTVGFGAAGVDADASTTGAFAPELMSFIVFGTSYTSTSASTLQRMMASFFCFFAFSCARSRATFFALRAISESLPRPSARTRPTTSWSSRSPPGSSTSPSTASRST